MVFNIHADRYRNKSFVDTHMPTEFLALSAESLEARKTAMSTASMEILISKY